MSRRSMVCVALLVFTAARGAAQTPQSDSAHCDAVLAAARVDSVQTALFVSAHRIDGGELPGSRVDAIASEVGAAFTPPRPFRLTVFGGGPRMRSLRTLSADTGAALRSPVLTGIYRLEVTDKGAITRLVVVRASLMPGFDSAAMTAIREGSQVAGVFVPPDHEDSMRVEVRFSTDSVRGARRIITGWFPRMPVVDAVPRSSNPAPPFPEAERRDSVTSGDVVLRFVVDRLGAPMLETIEIVRANSTEFLRAALSVMPQQIFAPASIHGCAVAQTVDYPFTFSIPEPARPRGLP